MGAYEVVREALRSWERPSSRGQRSSRFCAEPQGECLDSGDAGKVDFAKLKAQARRAEH
jgi:hypothetical protein